MVYHGVNEEGRTGSIFSPKIIHWNSYDSPFVYQGTRKRKATLFLIGSSVLRMEKHAAEAVGHLLAEAIRALKAGRAVGETDALKTIRISATSGYRNKAYQESLWKQYFTATRRQVARGS